MRGRRAAPRAAAAALWALAALAAVAAGAPAWAAEEGKGRGKVSDTRDRLREINRKLEQERQQAHEAAQRERNLAQEVRAIEADLQKKGRELQDLQAKLRGSAEHIAALTRETRAAEARLGRSRTLLARRLRAIYKQGRLAYIRLLLAADDMSGAATRLKYLASIAAQDRRVASTYQAVLADLTAKRQALEAYKAEVAAAREAAETRRHEIADEQRKHQILLAKVREEKLGHLTAARKLEAAARDLQNLISRLTREDAAPRRRGPATSVEPLPDGGPFATLKGKLPWPADGPVASAFGKQEHPKFRTVTYNRGIEISATMGRPVLAVHEGTVLYADWFRGYGRLVILDHGGGYFTLYAHASELLVKVGDHVARGQPIARVGDTGSLEGPQLYFEVRHRGKPQDPLAWLAPKAP